MEENSTEPKAISAPKSTYLTAVTTGLVTLSNLITNDVARKICVAISPALALTSSYIFKMVVHNIECKKGVRVFTTLINEEEQRLNTPRLTRGEITKIKNKIEKYKADKEKIEIKSIKVFS